MQRLTACAAALACAPLTPIHASPSSESPAPLDTVVVTADRQETALADTLASVTVIDRADLQRLQARNLVDVLSAQAGISIANQGGSGKLTSLFMRGTSSDHVLVLVNGVRFGSATAGIAAIQDIPVAQIERIEIVRGPRAALYGSDAIGGVIQIFTRDPVENQQFNASLTGGSFGRREAAIGLGHRGDNAWYRLDVSHDEVEGFDACENVLTAGCFANEPDDDGYNNTSVSGRAGYAFSQDTEIEFVAWQASGENFYDGFYNRTEYQRSSYSLRGKSSLMSGWSLQVRVGHSTDEADSAGAFGSGSVDTARDEVSLQTDLAFESGLLTIGADLRDDQVDSNTQYNRTSRQTMAGFGQFRYQLGDWSTDAAVRVIDDEQFGSETTGSFALGHDLTDHWKAWVSYGSAYHAPTFNDLYFPGASNPNLKPETSDSTEIGLRYTGDFRFNINAYETRLDNLIEFNPVTFTPVNISAARIRGLEARWSMAINAWHVSADIGLLDTENRSAANTGNELPRRPFRSLRIDVDRRIGDFSLGASLLAEDRRYDDLGNTVEVAGYGLLHLRGSWTINENWQLSARLGNALDRDYQTVAYYNQAGRNGQLTLRYQF